MSDSFLTLGKRLKHNLSEAKRLRLDQEARENRQAREKIEKHRRRVSLAFDDLKDKIRDAIEEGSTVQLTKLPKFLDCAVGWQSVPITSDKHQDHAQWMEEMDEWAQQNELQLTVIEGTDGAGYESWWSVQVTPR